MTSILNRRTVRGWELRQGVEQFAHQTAKHLGLYRIRVVWAAIPTAAINGNGTMILAAVKDDAVIGRATLVRYVGFVLHELLHRKYSRFDINGDTDYLRRLHNAVEDAWIERRAIREGVTGNIKAVLTELVQQIVDESQVADWTDPATYPFALAVYAREYGVKTPLAQGLEPIFAEATRRIDACQFSSDTLEIAKWVLQQLQTLDQPKQQPEQQPEQRPEQGNGEGDSQDDAQADGQGDGEADGQGDGQGDAQGEGEQAGPARAPAPGQDAIEVEPNLKGGKGTMGTSWTGAGVTTPGAHLRPHAIHDITAAVPGKLRHEVRRIFDNSGMTMFTRNRKTGSVNVHALARAGVTDRVFKQRRDVEGIDSSVVIVLDVSGSMRRDIATVVGVGAALVETLASAQVQVAVTSFASEASLVTPFGTPAAKVRQTLSRLGTGGDTNDYAAVRQAADMLLPRSEERKVIFVVTDGESVPSITKNCKEQCRAAQALGITVIGVGIGIDVSHVYPNAIRIDSVQDLGTTVFTKIKLAA
jgi:Mg-chelatase subunit ChlD